MDGVDTLRAAPEPGCIDVADALRAVMLATQGLGGAAFFGALTRQMSSTFGVRAAIAAELVGTAGRLRSLGVAANGNSIDDHLDYDPAGTPAGAVLDSGSLTIDASVRQRFPADRRLAILQAESYVGVALRDMDGDIAGILAVVHNRPIADTAAIEAAMTVLAARAGAELDRRRTEDALRASEMRYRYLVDDAFDFVAEVVDGRFVHTSRAYSDVLGYDDDELLGVATHEIVHPDDRAAVVDAARREFSGQSADRMLSRVRCKDGSWRWLECLCRTYRASDGVRTLVFSRDITEIRRAEESLRSSEERFRTLIDDLGVGVMLQDADTRVLVANRAACDLLGVDPGRLVGRTTSDPRLLAWREDGSRFPPEARPVPLCIATGVPVRDVVMGVDRAAAGTAPAGRAWMSVTAEPRLRADGSVDQVITTFHDVSARIQAEDQRERFFDLSLDLMCVSGFDGYLKRVNASFQRILGWSSEELLGRPVIDFVHPEDRTRTLGEQIKMSVGQPSFSFETRFLCRDGAYRMIRWTSSPDAARKVFYATGRDVTGERQDALAA